MPQKSRPPGRPTGKGPSGADKMPVQIFIHGLESSNQGSKALYFRERFPDMIIPTFTGDLQQRMARLNEVLAGRSGIRLVGSSFGGLMGTLFTMAHESAVIRLVLLAPAIHVMDAVSHPVHPVSIPVTVYHGRTDEVIPLEKVSQCAKTYFVDLDFHVVEDDHFLHRTFTSIDWASLLA